MIFLGLGSNMGDEVENIQRALSLMPQKGIEVLDCSSFYANKAWGVESQADFVNAVCSVNFAGSPEELLIRVQQIEDEMGRTRLRKWGPRLIDIDILEFNSETHESPTLIIPHPYYTERDFVLLPLSEIQPGWIPTGKEEPVEALILALPEREIYILADADY